MLNVVNFGAGTYVLYAEMKDDGTVEANPDAYWDAFARPARLLPVEAKALVSAIDLIGDHLPAAPLASVREKVVAALGRDPVEEGLQVVQPVGEDVEIGHVVSRAIATRRILAFEYYKESEDEFSERVVEPHALMNGKEALVPRRLGPGQGRRAPLPPGPHQGRRGARGALRAPAPRSTRPPTSRAGRAPARSRPRAGPACGSPPSARAGPARSAA